MARKLLLRADMRTLTLLCALLAAPLLAANAQDANVADGAIAESTEISGLPSNQLSPGLRQAIDALVGTPLNREHGHGLERLRGRPAPRHRAHDPAQADQGARAEPGQGEVTRRDKTAGRRHVQSGGNSQGTACRP